MPVLLLFALSCLAAFAYGARFVHLPISTARTLVKGTAVGALTGIAILSHAPIALIIALALGTLGDLFLSRDGERNFLLGLAAFLIGHVAYIVLLAQLGGRMPLLLQSPWRIGASLILIGIAALVIRRMVPHLGPMRLPVLVYACVILLMGLMAISMPPYWPIILATLGALMFIASDAILGFELFVFKEANRPRAAMVLWALYWGGQAVILVSILLTTAYAGTS